MGDQGVEWFGPEADPLPTPADDDRRRIRFRRPRARLAVGLIAAVAASAVGLAAAAHSGHAHAPAAAQHSAPPSDRLRTCASLLGTSSSVWQVVLDGPGCTYTGASAALVSQERCLSGDLLYATTGNGPGFWGLTGYILNSVERSPTSDPVYAAAKTACEGELPSASLSTSVTTSTRPDPSARLPRDPSDVAGARIGLPQGWEVLQVAAFSPDGIDYPPQLWCIAPVGISPTDVVNNCPIELQAVANDRADALEPEIRGGFIGNPGEPCGFPGGTAGETAEHEQAADLSFGGRTSLFRRWTFTCRGGVQVAPSEQYVVATEPAFVLSSARADSTVHAAMSLIARQSMLPTQTAPLYLLDRGYVRRIEHEASGELLYLDRVAGDPPANANPATYPYLVPASMMTRAHVQVGQLVDIRTNGRTVTAIGPPYTV